MPASPLSYCLSLLKRRLRSRWELDQAMERRGFERDARLVVLDQLEKQGLVNDRQFALAWVHTRDRLAPRGEFVLRNELRGKGVAEEIIAGVLRERKEEAADPEEEQPSELELARELVKRRQRGYERLPADTRRRRIAALLQRRGFSMDTIRRILNA
ncbi:recombination regulator RecX [Patescibacteria group bacterium]|nr:recombination regulator RecX [Patescibacteria group bacterium]